ncbi:phage capsid scaffolding protein GpO [Neisseria sp. HMSC06F02]|nr:phage capsid scaffolding protein GpO [Neisseria sp. HMSC06F02]
MNKFAQSTQEKFSDRWFCIGKSGATVDGRTIESADLIAAAAAYDPELYGARINLEHYRPYSPKNDYSGLGDVLELKAETADGVTRLYARIDPTEKMLGYIKDREKVYTSMEIMKPFGDTGKAYLVGLAMTDSPASMGTTMLKFRQIAPDDPNFTAAYTQMESQDMPKTENQPKTEKKGIFAVIHDAMFSKKTDPEQQTQAPQQIDYSQEIDALNKELEQSAQITEKIVEDYAALRKEFDEFKAKVESTPVNAAAAHTGATTVADSEY